jgi:hypothetical protein
MLAIREQKKGSELFNLLKETRGHSTLSPNSMSIARRVARGSPGATAGLPAVFASFPKPSFHLGVIFPLLLSVTSVAPWGKNLYLHTGSHFGKGKQSKSKGVVKK